MKPPVDSIYNKATIVSSMSVALDWKLPNGGLSRDVGQEQRMIRHGGAELEVFIETKVSQGESVWMPFSGNRRDGLCVMEVLHLNSGLTDASTWDEIDGIHGRKYNETMLVTAKDGKFVIPEFTEVIQGNPSEVYGRLLRLKVQGCQPMVHSESVNFPNLRQLGIWSLPLANPDVKSVSGTSFPMGSSSDGTKFAVDSAERIENPKMRIVVKRKWSEKDEDLLRREVVWSDLNQKWETSARQAHEEIGRWMVTKEAKYLHQNLPGGPVSTPMTGLPIIGNSADQLNFCNEAVADGFPLANFHNLILATMLEMRRLKHMTTPEQKAAMLDSAGLAMHFSDNVSTVIAAHKRYTADARFTPMLELMTTPSGLKLGSVIIKVSGDGENHDIFAAVSKAQNEACKQELDNVTSVIQRSGWSSQPNVQKDVQASFGHGTNFKTFGDCEDSGLYEAVQTVNGAKKLAVDLLNSDATNSMLMKGFHYVEELRTPEGEKMYGDIDKGEFVSYWTAMAPGMVKMLNVGATGAVCGSHPEADKNSGFQTPVNCDLKTCQDSMVEGLGKGMLGGHAYRISARNKKVTETQVPVSLLTGNMIKEGTPSASPILTKFRVRKCDKTKINEGTAVTSDFVLENQNQTNKQAEVMHMSCQVGAKTIEVDLPQCRSRDLLTTQAAAVINSMGGICSAAACPTQVRYKNKTPVNNAIPGFYQGDFTQDGIVFGCPNKVWKAFKSTGDVKQLVGQSFRLPGHTLTKNLKFTTYVLSRNMTKFELGMKQRLHRVYMSSVMPWKQKLQMLAKMPRGYQINMNHYATRDQNNPCVLVTRCTCLSKSNAEEDEARRVLAAKFNASVHCLGPHEWLMVFSPQ